MIAIESLSVPLWRLGWLLGFGAFHVSRIKEALWNLQTRAKSPWDETTTPRIHLLVTKKGRLALTSFSLAPVICGSDPARGEIGLLIPSLKNPLLFAGFFFVYQAGLSQRASTNAHRKKIGLRGCMHELVEHISYARKNSCLKAALFAAILISLIQADTSPYKLACLILRPSQLQYYHSITHTVIPLVIKGKPQEPSWTE